MAEATSPSESPGRLFAQYEIMEKVLLNLSVEELCVNQRVSKFWKDLICRSQPLQKKMFLMPEGPVIPPIPKGEPEGEEGRRTPCGLAFPGAFRINPIADTLPAHKYSPKSCARFPLYNRPSRLYPCPVEMKLRPRLIDWNDDYTIPAADPEWIINIRILAPEEHDCSTLDESHHATFYPDAVTRPEASWRKMLVTQPPISSLELYDDLVSIRPTTGLTFGEMDSVRERIVAQPNMGDAKHYLTSYYDHWSFVAPDLFKGNHGLVKQFFDGHNMLVDRKKRLCGCQEPLEQALVGIKWEGDHQRTRAFEKYPKEWPMPSHTDEYYDGWNYNSGGSDAGGSDWEGSNAGGSDWEGSNAGSDLTDYGYRYQLHEYGEIVPKWAYDVPREHEACPWDEVETHPQWTEGTFASGDQQPSEPDASTKAS